MNNPFKAGDKVTMNLGTDWLAAGIAKGTTNGKLYTLNHVGLDNPRDNHTELDVVFTDDVGDTVVLHAEHVTLAKE